MNNKIFLITWRAKNAPHLHDIIGAFTQEEKANEYFKILSAHGDEKKCYAIEAMETNILKDEKK